MTVYKVLLHIGLHKTATTSLQYNVFHYLDQVGKINFLGVLRREDGSEEYNSVSKIISLAELEGHVSEKRLAEIKNEFKERLRADSINVLSDELITSSIHYDIDRVLLNLSRILSEYDVTVLVVLRNQLEMLLSRYSEHYASCFSGDRKRNTFEKFANDIYKNSQSREYLEFRYDCLLDSVASCYNNIRVLLYEDLIFDQGEYFMALGEVLDEDEAVLRKMFYSGVRNKTKRHMGKSVSNALTLRNIISSKLKLYGFHKMKVFSPIFVIWRVVSPLLNMIRVSGVVYHEGLNDELAKDVRRALQVSDAELFSRLYNIPKSKLLKYGYIRDDI